MDPQIIAIGAAGCILSAIIIYLISVFAMKEKTFEEVLEEQKRRNEEEKLKLKNEKKAEKEHKKKFKKGKDKDKDKDKDKSKEKSGQSSDSELKFEQKMVNLEIEPEIIEPTETLPLTSKRPKTKKNQKPILVNKEEKPLVTTDKSAKEFSHKTVAPKDELELKREQPAAPAPAAKEKVTPEPAPVVAAPKEKHTSAEHQNKSSKKASEAKAEKPQHEEKVHKEKVSKVEKQAERTVETPKKSHDEPEKKRAKAKGGAEESGLLNGTNLLTAVQSATLNEKEIQSLVDVLLNRLGTDARSKDWNKKTQKGDPVVLLKKQLEERERSLQQEQALAMSANSKMKELTQQLQMEKTKLTTLEKCYQEKLTHQVQEIEALHARMQQSHEQHQREVKSLQTTIHQYEQSNDRNLVQKLQEEKKILTDTIAKAAVHPPAEVNNLKQKVQILEKELGSNVVKLNAAEKSKTALEMQLSKIQDELKKSKLEQKDTVALLSKKLEEVNKEVRKSQAHNNSLMVEKRKSQEESRKTMDALTTAQNEVKTLKTKLEELQRHLKANDTKDLENKLRETERKKLDLEGNVKNLEKQLTDSTRRYSELEKQLQDLRHENFTLAEELKVTQERQVGEGQESPTGAVNGEMNQNTDKILNEKNEEIDRLSTELQTTKSEITNLKEQLEAQKKKNNELREKNWKAMEALEKAEKAVTVKVDSAVKLVREKVSSEVSDTESLDKGILQRLFPDIKVNEKLSHKEWVKQFEKHASVITTNISEQKTKIQQLESENTQYRTVVKETENKLHQLESSIESEEKKWKEKLQQAASISEKCDKQQKRIEELEKINSSYEKQIKEYKTKLETLEKELLQLKESAKSEEEAVNTKQILEKCYQLEIRIGELEDENTEYQKQIENYRNVLSSTEKQLTYLENSAKVEEAKWSEQLQEMKSSLEKSNKEVENLKQQIKKLKGSTEMEVKVGMLENQLKLTEEKCSSLQKEAEESKEKIVVLNKQIETASNSTADLEELKRLLEVEKKKTKDLSSNIVKLNGIIKTGQDALKQEQDAVAALQKQLVEKEKASGSTAGSEVEQLKAKLADKEKHLEHEMAANKQLSQRLAQLGVSTALVGNDVGTSV